MYYLILLAMTLALTLSLVGAMYYAALALVDSFKRDTTPFLAPVYVACCRDGQLAPVPFGVWQVARLASCPRHPVSVRETNDALAARV